MADKKHYIGVDVGGTNVKVVALTEAGDVITKTQFSTNDSELAEWSTGVRDKLASLQVDLGEPLGIGVSSPGIAGQDHRCVTWMAGRMEETVGFDWTDYLKKPFFIPVLNDAKAALVGEAWLGAAKGAHNAILLTLGTGVGGAAIVDGRLLHGACGRAGHLGHISLDPLGGRGITCCPGSLEDMIGGSTLLYRSNGKFSDTQALIDAANKGDWDARQVWLKSIQALAAGIASLVNVLDPEVVILGGGMIRAGKDLFEPLAEAMKPIEWLPFGGDGVPVIPATLGEFAGAIGVARFAMTFGQENS